MARILGYIASSLDGMIADADGNLEWLFKYDSMAGSEHDYRTFIERIKTVVMGRGTYDYIANESSAWAYHDKRVYVVTSSPINSPKGPLEVRSDVDALISELRALRDGDIWMLGGGQLQMAFLERGALDEIEIYIIPELLGGGRPLFPSTGYQSLPELLGVQALDRGCVRLHYRITEPQS